MQDLKVAIVQLDLAWEDPVANRALVDEVLDSVSAVDLIVLPEMLTTGFSLNPKAITEDMNGESIKWLENHAAKLGSVVACSLAIRDGDNFRNRFLWMKPDRTYDYYDKRHVIGLLGEDKVITPGSERKIFELCGWKVLPQVCYDLRFPVFARNRGDYDLYLNVANWPVSRELHWRTLLAARAIENQVYAIGVNRVGTDPNGLVFAGASRLVSPDGFVDIELGAEAQVEIVTLFGDRLKRIRKDLPFLNDSDCFKIQDLT